MDHCRPTAVTDHRKSGLLEIVWADGGMSRLRHAALRLHCRCAACERARRRGGATPELDAGLRLVHVEAVGEQGLHLGFSDGHDRGIFPWAYLRSLESL